MCAHLIKLSSSNAIEMGIRCINIGLFDEIMHWFNLKQSIIGEQYFVKGQEQLVAVINNKEQE